MGFFKSGFTRADLNLLGKILELKDRFTMEVIAEAISQQWGKGLDSRGLITHVDLAYGKKFDV